MNSVLGIFIFAILLKPLKYNDYPDLVNINIEKILLENKALKFNSNKSELRFKEIIDHDEFVLDALLELPADRTDKSAETEDQKVPNGTEIDINLTAHLSEQHFESSGSRVDDQDGLIIRLSAWNGLWKVTIRSHNKYEPSIFEKDISIPDADLKNLRVKFTCLRTEYRLSIFGTNEHLIFRSNSIEKEQEPIKPKRYLSLIAKYPGDDSGFKRNGWFYLISLTASEFKPVKPAISARDEISTISAHSEGLILKSGNEIDSALAEIEYFMKILRRGLGIPYVSPIHQGLLEYLRFHIKYDAQHDFILKELEKLTEFMKSDSYKMEKLLDLYPSLLKSRHNLLRVTMKLGLMEKAIMKELVKLGALIGILLFGLGVVVIWNNLTADPAKHLKKNE